MPSYSRSDVTSASLPEYPGDYSLLQREKSRLCRWQRFLTGNIGDAFRDLA